MVFVSEEISPREMTFHLASCTSKVPWQKLVQCFSCVFVCKMLKSHLASQKQIRPADDDCVWISKPSYLHVMSEWLSGRTLNWAPGIHIQSNRGKVFAVIFCYHVGKHIVSILPISSSVWKTRVVHVNAWNFYLRQCPWPKLIEHQTWKWEVLGFQSKFCLVINKFG